ncbi:MAG: carboxypeptidase regulatory-like domain-containing protein [Aeromicrobium sp.]|uniref:carboxypeptidase regulatory-like domain-containing protein n=1 Tax=Aeromicrobium sp. TaxID=1871063 RepID=UPI0039E6FC84
MSFHRSPRRIARLVAIVLVVLVAAILPSVTYAVGGGVSGVVRGEGNAPVADIHVQAYELVDHPEEGWSDWEYAESTESAADGSYELSLDPGTYRLAFSDHSPGDGGPRGHTPYVGDDDPWEGDLLEVEVGSTVVTGQDRQLVRSAAVTGVVTDPSGDPLEGAEVYAWGGGWATTEADGSYVIGGIDPEANYWEGGGQGAFWIRFDAPWDSGYAHEYWNDQASIATADRVSAQPGQTVTGMNAQLDLGGSISGTVTDPDGQEIDDVDIRLWSFTDTQGWQDVDDYYGYTQDGGYSITGLKPGQYRVGFSHPDYADQFWNDAKSVDVAQTVTVVGGQDVTGIDAVMNYGPSISGRVTRDDGGDAVAGTNVTLYRSHSNGSIYQQAFATTDENGEYRFDDLESGSYAVSFAQYDGASGLAPEIYDDRYAPQQGAEAVDPTLVQITDSPVTGIDASLSAAATISGTLTDEATGDPLVNGYATVERQNASGQWIEWDSVGVDDNGSYEMSVAPGTYRVSFSSWGMFGGNSHVPEYYDDVPYATPQAATPVVVGVGDQQTGVDAELVKKGSISGVVSQDGGGLVGGAGITVYRQTDDGGWERVAYPGGWWADHTVESDYVTGAYEVADLDPGVYRVRVESGQHVTEYYEDMTVFNDATDITLTEGQQRPGVDVSLDTGLTVSGQVDGLTSGTYASATAYRLRAGVWTEVRNAQVDSGGSYSLPGLTPGTYRVGVYYYGSGRTGHLYYEDATRIEDATDVVLTDTSATGIDVTLPEPPVGDLTVSGTVTADDGPLDTQNWSSVELFPVDGNGDYYSVSIENGEYTIENVLPGSYQLRVNAGGYATEFWNDKYVQQDADTIVVTDDAQFDVELTRGFAASGTVRGNAGQSVGGAYLTAYRVTSSGRHFMDSTWSDTDGEYEFSGLPAGQYVFSAAADSFATEYWDNQSTLASANPVTVGATTPSVDFGLTPQSEVPTVEGAVSFPAGTPAGAWASVTLVDAGTGERVQETQVVADHPNYSFAVAPGSYQVVFAGGSTEEYNDARFARSYYHNAPDGQGASATTVTVDTESVTLATQQLTLGGVVSGRVTYEGGEPVEWCRVTAQDEAGQRVSRTDRTDTSGAFQITGLSAGQYRLTMEDCGTAWYYNADAPTELSPTADGSTVVTVTAGGTVALTPTWVIPDDVETVANTEAPTVSGTAEVGSTLTADPGVWNPSDVTLSYQWLADGEPVEGATAATFAVTLDQVGAKLSVTVSGTSAGRLPGQATSAETSVVPQPVVANTAPPTISGSPVIGQTLTASPGTWTPAGSTSAYQWFADGDPIAGATDATFVLTAGQEGKKIAVRVTGSSPGYASAEAMSAETAEVERPSVLNTAVPTVSGTAMVGQTLTVSPGTWSPSNASLAYQWLADGAPITGATGQTLALAAAQKGKKISVKVTGTASGHHSAEATSVETGAVAEQTVVNTAAPTISGTAKVGQTLTASPGAWSPGSGVAFAYQWLAEGQPIQGATGQTLVLTAAEQGKKISVRVTGTRSGYVQGVATSGQTVAVAAATPSTPSCSFTDVSSSHVFRSEICWLAAAGVTTGYAGNTFRPSQPVLREQMAAFLYRFRNDGANPPSSAATATFSDVSVSHVFSRHIKWLTDEGITTGYAGNAFRPGQPVLREQMAAFLYRLAGSPAVTNLPTTSPFKDVSTGHTFYEEMVWLSRTGITTGYPDGTFRPGQPVLREQMAAFLQRFHVKGY